MVRAPRLRAIEPRRVRRRSRCRPFAGGHEHHVGTLEDLFDLVAVVFSAA